VQNLKWAQARRKLKGGEVSVRVSTEPFPNRDPLSVGRKKGMEIGQRLLKRTGGEGGSIRHPQGYLPADESLTLKEQIGQKGGMNPNSALSQRRSLPFPKYSRRLRVKGGLSLKGGEAGNFLTDSPFSVLTKEEKKKRCRAGRKRGGKREGALIRNRRKSGRGLRGNSGREALS